MENTYPMLTKECSITVFIIIITIIEPKYANFLHDLTNHGAKEH